MKERYSYYNNWFSRCKKCLGIKRKIKWGFYNLEKELDGELNETNTIKVNNQLYNPEDIERTLLYELIRVKMGSWNWWAWEENDTLLEQQLIDWEDYLYKELKKEKKEDLC